MTVPVAGGVYVSISMNGMVGSPGAGGLLPEPLSDPSSFIRE